MTEGTQDQLSWMVNEIIMPNSQPNDSQAQNEIEEGGQGRQQTQTGTQSGIKIMIYDKFGNYVIQKCIEVLQKMQNVTDNN